MTTTNTEAVLLAVDGGATRIGLSDAHGEGRILLDWRELADQLTPDQIQHLETSPTGDSASLIFDALEYVESNGLSRQFAHIPLPPGAATDLLNWRWLENGKACRVLTWMRAEVELPHYPGLVEVVGEQAEDGSYTKFLELTGWDREDASPAQARQLASLLIAAAHVMEAAP